MAGKVLGPEWGAFAGLTEEQALEVMRTHLVGEDGKATVTDPDADPNDTRTMDLVKNLKQVQVAPAAHEFVGQRNSARARARAAVLNEGEDWDLYDAAVETIVSRGTAEQQTSPAVWYEAWWYAWSLAERQRKMEAAKRPPNGPSDPTHSPPQDAPPNTVTDTKVTRIADRSTRPRPVETKDPFKIEDPTTRETRDKFRKHFGVSISDEEWIRLENEVRTYEDYKALQDDLKARNDRSK